MCTLFIIYHETAFICLHCQILTPEIFTFFRPVAIDSIQKEWGGGLSREIPTWSLEGTFNIKAMFAYWFVQLEQYHTTWYPSCKPILSYCLSSNDVHPMNPWSTLELWPAMIDLRTVNWGWVALIYRDILSVARWWHFLHFDHTSN